MHPRLAEVVDYAEGQRRALIEAVDRVPEPHRDRRTAADRWSVAEILEHLHRVERGIARLATTLAERISAGGVRPESNPQSVMDSLDEFRLLDRNRHMMAPEPVLPRGRFRAGEALVALGESRQALLSALAAVDGFALDELTYDHPLLGRLNLYQWVLFIGQHEARHAHQIHEIAEHSALGGRG